MAHMMSMEQCTFLSSNFTNSHAFLIVSTLPFSFSITAEQQSLPTVICIALLEKEQILLLKLLEVFKHLGRTNKSIKEEATGISSFSR